MQRLRGRGPCLEHSLAGREHSLAGRGQPSRLPRGPPPPTPRGLPLFARPQVFNVPGRCFPVDVIHAREDHSHDYVAAAVDTVLQIHTRQPPGAQIDTHAPSRRVRK
jgi:hypothetical protein